MSADTIESDGISLYVFCIDTSSLSNNMSTLCTYVCDIKKQVKWDHIKKVMFSLQTESVVQYSVPVGGALVMIICNSTATY